MIRLLTHNFGWKLLSLALAVALWYAVVGEPELATFLIVPIQYKNQPRDLEISSDVPERVHLEVRAPSGKLSPVNLSGAAVVLDLGSVRRAGEQTFTINEANTSLPPGVSFYRAVPSELRFQFDHQLSRDVPVEARFAGPPPPGYRIVRQTVAPRTLRVIGPENHVQRLDAIHTDAIDLSGVVSQAEFHGIHAYLGDPHMRLVSAPNITVTVQLEKVDK